LTALTRIMRALRVAAIAATLLPLSAAPQDMRDLTATYRPARGAMVELPGVVLVRTAINGRMALSAAGSPLATAALRILPSRPPPLKRRRNKRGESECVTPGF